MIKLRNTIKTMIANHWKGKENLLIDDNTPLISSGIIDSFHIVELLLILEKEYSLKINQTEIGTDNFDTIQQIHTHLQEHK